jgi:hypothetical protein
MLQNRATTRRWGEIGGIMADIAAWSAPMKIMPVKITPVLAFAGLLAFPIHAGAGTIDCSLFPDTHSRFACYDNISRAPKPEPETVKPAGAKPGVATARNRKAVRTY